MRAYWYFVRPRTAGVKALLFHNGKVLFIRHSYTPKMWSLPGGGIKRDEDVLVALKREIWEELGVEAKNFEYCGESNSNREFKRDKVFVYRGELVSGEVKLDNIELIDAKWFAQNEISKLTPFTQAIVDLCLSN